MSRTPIKIKHPFECPKCEHIFGHEVTNAEYLYDVAKERDKYKAALEKIANLERFELYSNTLVWKKLIEFQDIAREAVKNETK